MDKIRSIIQEDKTIIFNGANEAINLQRQGDYEYNNQICSDNTHQCWEEPGPIHRISHHNV